MKYLVTGGAGFIGSHLVDLLLSDPNNQVINIDCCTYAADIDHITTSLTNLNYKHLKVDIVSDNLRDIFDAEKPDVVFHLAAESHVDRSIDGPGSFISTNIVGTYNMLEAARQFLSGHRQKQADFRFVHVSTDEVYGHLPHPDDVSPDAVGELPSFMETTPYNPTSPYSASKAASDHLARAWFKTFGVPVIVTNCSNNYGPRQFPEKLIPLMILNGLDGKALPVYGNGRQIRDWLHVNDHARALKLVSEKGKIGETYNIGGLNEKYNLDVVKTICDILDMIVPLPEKVEYTSRRNLITFVNDRPAHDARYAIDCSKIKGDLGWRPAESFESGLKKTVQWYCDNLDWSKRISQSRYAGERLGVNK